MANFDGTDDTFDSREVLDRIAELTGMWEEGANFGEDEATHRAADYSLSGDDWAIYLGEDDAAELEALIELQKDAMGNVPDWAYGETFISDDFFEDYARELAEDVGAINPDARWPLNHIDWAAAADALKMDYTSFEFRGTTYWAR